MISSSLNGRTLRWKNKEGVDSKGVIRDAFVGLQQVERPISKIVQTSPVWIFLVEVMVPSKFAEQLVLIDSTDESVKLDPLA